MSYRAFIITDIGMGRKRKLKMNLQPKPPPDGIMEIDLVDLVMDAPAVLVVV